MAYADIYNAANDSLFQGRCLVASWIAAGDIINEATNTSNHATRLDWANKVLSDRANLTHLQLAMQVLRNSTIAANPGAALDSDIQFQVNSIVPALILIG